MTFFPCVFRCAFWSPPFRPRASNWCQKASKSEPKWLPKPLPGQLRTRFRVFLDFDATPTRNLGFHGSSASEIDENSTQFPIKTAPRKKHALGVHFYVKNRYQKVLQNRSQDGKSRTMVFVTLSTLDPQGRPRSAQGRPRSAQGCPRSAQRCPK